MVDHGLPTDNVEVVGDIYRAFAKWTPDASALTAHSAYGGKLTLNYAELDRLTNAVALSLVDHGVKRGDRVAFLMSNAAGIEGVLTYIGAHKAAAVALPINGRLTPAEVVPLAKHAEIAALVVESAFLSHAIAVRDQLENPPMIFIAAEEKHEGMIPFSTLLDRDKPVTQAELPTVAPTDMADFLFTSGTTAASKCVMLTHENCVASAHILARFPGIRQDDVYLSPFPFFTSSGVHTSLFTTATVGAHYVMSTEVQADALLREIEESGATMVGAVPSIFDYMAKSPVAEEVDLTRVRYAFHGGAPVSPHQVAQYMRLFPRAEIMNVFGQTESGNPGTTLPGKYALAKAGSIGKQGMQGVKVRVVGHDGNDISGAGVGELLLASKAIMVGYFKNEEETQNTIRDGWLYTGDLVRVDDDGFMFVYDRKKDIIIRGGLNIASIEVENALSSHPDIQEAAVVSKPHSELGEDLVAFVVASGDSRPTTEQLRAFVVPLIANYKIPRDIRYIEELPRNPTGKILKRQLRNDV